jgi:hypothetical protein
MESVIVPLKDFAQQSVRLIKRCNKPDAKGAEIQFQCGRIQRHILGLSGIWNCGLGGLFEADEALHWPHNRSRF